MSPGRDEMLEFRPAFDADGLIPVIVTHARDNTVLMFAWMNAEALRLTQQTGLAHFWSRSRNRLWKKGETSGETLAVTELLTDCDQDVVLMKVVPQGLGAACHTGRRSCFYRRIAGERLEVTDDSRLFDPADAYRP